VHVLYVQALNSFQGALPLTPDQRFCPWALLRPRVLLSAAAPCWPCLTVHHSSNPTFTRPTDNMTSLIKLFNLDGEFAVMVDNLGTRFRIIRHVRYTCK